MPETRKLRRINAEIRVNNVDNRNTAVSGVMRHIWESHRVPKSTNFIRRGSVGENGQNVLPPPQARGPN